MKIIAGMAIAGFSFVFATTFIILLGKATLNFIDYPNPDGADTLIAGSLAVIIMCVWIAVGYRISLLIW